MNKIFIVIITIAFSYFTIGCGFYTIKKPEQTIHNVIPVEEPQEFSISIIEGKTTKKHIIDVLGMPDIINSSLSYSFDKNKICKLQLTQKDGTIMNVILGPRDKYKYRKFSASFDYDGPTIVDRVGVY